LIGYLCEEGGGGARGRGGVRKVFLREKNKKMLVEGFVASSLEQSPWVGI
jgi:hypothetical protein